jgi:mannan endo-1,6-alpha-mannosidase
MSVRIFTTSTKTYSRLLITLSRPGSIKSAAKSVANGLIAPYNGTKPGGIPGIFPLPYYWWSAAAIWDGLIDYWYLTGDDAHNVVVDQALLFQTGPNNDYMPPNQTKSEVCSPTPPLSPRA